MGEQEGALLLQQKDKIFKKCGGWGTTAVIVAAAAAATPATALATALVATLVAAAAAHSHVHLTDPLVCVHPPLFCLWCLTVKA